MIQLKRDTVFTKPSYILIRPQATLCLHITISETYHNCLINQGYQPGFCVNSLIPFRLHTRDRAKEAYHVLENKWV